MHWNWQEICADPLLSALPFRVESDRWGSIVLRPLLDAAQSHRQSRLAALLVRWLGGGKSFLSFPVRTAAGVKVADVAWLSDARLTREPHRGTAAALAPEICVEFRTRGQHPGEIEARKRLYFLKGAAECWVCDLAGKISFFEAAGQVDRSRLCPGFPLELEPSTLAT